MFAIKAVHRGFMTPSYTPSNTPIDDSAIWHSLKQAIATSSGFQSWKQERSSDKVLSDLPVDQQLQRYLRETLETLAY